MRTCFSLLTKARRRPTTARPSSYLSNPCYCTDAINENSKVKIFDRNLKRKQRDRAAWLMRPNDSFVDAVAENLLDRLEDCRKSFPTAFCLGGSMGAVRRLLHGRGYPKII